MINQRKLFRIALTHRDMTATEFAELHKISRQLVHRVLDNPSESVRVASLVNEFINSAMHDLHIRLDALHDNGTYVSKNNTLQV